MAVTRFAECPGGSCWAVSAALSTAAPESSWLAASHAEEGQDRLEPFSLKSFVRPCWTLAFPLDFSLPGSLEILAFTFRLKASHPFTRWLQSLSRSLRLYFLHRYHHCSVLSGSPLRGPILPALSEHSFLAKRCSFSSYYRRLPPSSRSAASFKAAPYYVQTYVSTDWYQPTRPEEDG